MERVTGGQFEVGLLLFIFVMIAVTNFIDTTAYAARLAGVRTKQLAVANSLFAMLTFGSRMTTFLYLPLIAGIVETAAKQGTDPFFALEFVLLGAAVGTAAAILLLPATDRFYELGIQQMEKHETSMRVFKSLFFSKQGLKELAGCWRAPKWSMWKGIGWEGVPKDMIILNAVLYGLFTVGSIAAYYAGAFEPDIRLLGSSLSGAINAVAAFLLLFLVDPRGALIMDQGIHRKLDMGVVRSSMVLLAVSRLAGTILSLLVLYPGGMFVAFLAKLIDRFIG
ncbi:lipid II flippase family protein [Effusibacillus lacus]|nr:DUF2837 family protein [Effusibacillus lacus]